MQIVDVIILGVLQGLTEFLPVSSSGHLVLGQYLLNVKSPGNTLEILFHIGTLGSVIFVFSLDIMNILITIKKKSTQKLLIYIFVATIPAIIIGLSLSNKIETLFESVNSVGFALLFTGLVLILSSIFKNKNSENSLFASMVIGFGQALAIIPGISRSGMTIALALFFGFSPKESAKFSFLLSIPVIAGAGILGIQDIQSNEIFSADIIIAALLTSFLIGIIALKVLIKLLELGKFYIFGVYCICLGSASIFI